MRRSDAMLALERPRSTWLRKLSLSPDRTAIVRSVQRRNRRSARSRSPTSTSAATSSALDGIWLLPSDPVEGKLKQPYGVAEGGSMRPSCRRGWVAGSGDQSLIRNGTETMLDATPNAFRS